MPVRRFCVATAESGGLGPLSRRTPLNFFLLFRDRPLSVLRLVYAVLPISLPLRSVRLRTAPLRALSPTGLLVPSCFCALSAGDGLHPVIVELSAFVAGPWITSPFTSNRDPWQGQSQVRSVSFQPTRQPI